MLSIVVIACTPGAPDLAFLPATISVPRRHHPMVVAFRQIKKQKSSTPEESGSRASTPASKAQLQLPERDDGKFDVYALLHNVVEFNELALRSLLACDPKIYKCDPSGDFLACHPLKLSSSGDGEIKNFKAPWARDDCMKSLKSTGLYEA